MQIIVATISARAAPAGSTGEVFQSYVQRASRYSPTEHRVFPTEARMLAFLNRAAGRTLPVLVLADGRGEQITSRSFAETLRKARDSGAQLCMLAIGPADGWSPATLAHAHHTIAFGRITLPHELAAVVLAEQVYRALTILAGHPYHSGH